MSIYRRTLALAVFFTSLAAGTDRLSAARLTVDLGDAPGVTLVAALNRFDQDGNLRRAVDPNAKIEAPDVDFKASSVGGKWVFENLPPGKYDLLLIAQGRVRIEGFHYAPVLEFDPFFPGDATTDEATAQAITEQIAASRHYENRVEPLYMGGDKKAIRTLVMLIRDQPTSYTPGAGTMRHEIWQFTWNYGGWTKEKRTRVLDRVLLQVSELRQWTWLWDPKLGGIEVKTSPVTLKYQMPDRSGPKTLKGLYPY